MSSSCFGQDSLTIAETYSKYHDQNFTVSPFFWLLGLKGEILAPPIPSNYPEPPPPRFEVDVGFDEIRNSLRFFLMLSTEYRAKKFLIKANVTSLILEGEAVTPFELISDGIEYRFSYLTSEVLGGYRFINQNKVDLNVLLGVRMLNTRIEGSTNILNTQFSGERNVFWYDPILGIEIKYRPIPKLMLHAYTDFGPIRNVDSYKLMLEAAFYFTKVFSLGAGYRNYYINSESDEKDTIYKGRVYGPFIRFGFQF